MAEEVRPNPELRTKNTEPAKTQAKHRTRFAVGQPTPASEGPDAPARTKLTFQPDSPALHDKLRALEQAKRALTERQPPRQPPAASKPTTEATSVRKPPAAAVGAADAQSVSAQARSRRPPGTPARKSSTWLRIGHVIEVVDTVFGAVSAVQQIIAWIQAQDDPGPLIISGPMNPQRTTLLLPTGEKLAAQEIQRVCKQAHKLCVLVAWFGCDTDANAARMSGVMEALVTAALSAADACGAATPCDRETLKLALDQRLGEALGKVSDAQSAGCGISVVASLDTVYVAKERQSQAR